MEIGFPYFAVVQNLRQLGDFFPMNDMTVTAPGGTEIADEELFHSGVTGLENITSADLLIPRLTVIQALSPQLQRNKPEYIEGAQIGDFCDTGTNEVFKGPIELLPVFYATVQLEWAPRNSGKGLVKNHGTDRSILEHTVRDEKNRNILSNGNYIAETATFYVLNLTAGGRRSFVPLSSTQLKAGRRWCTMITAERVNRGGVAVPVPVLFYRSWIATSIEQSNAEGNWMGWKFSPDKKVMDIDPTKNLLREADAFARDAKAGLVKGDVAADPVEAGRDPDGAM